MKDPKIPTPEEQKHMFWNAVCIMLIWVVFILVCLFLGSCKSLQSETKYNYRDSIITHIYYDTVHVTITDTISVHQSTESSKESTTEIHFGEGGGTYNAQTGEATNVQSVKQSSKEKELQDLVAIYRHVADSLAATNDSLQHALTEAHGEEHVQQNTADITPRTGWDRFCTWWVIISWILIILAVAGWCFKKFYLHK